jgi:ATP-dependent DNA helicase RecG
MSSAIESMMREGESETLEFKTGRAGADAVARAVCGMLNQQGGIVLWGVDDAGKAAGIDDAKARAEELNRQIMHRMNPRPLLSVTVHSIGAKEVVAVDVPIGTEKPYSLDRVIWVRVGQSTLRADVEQSSRIIEKSAAALSRWEREPMPGFSEEDCDLDELAQARKEIEGTGRFGIAVPSSHHDLLNRLYLLRNGQLANAAVVLFARETRAWAPNLALRITVYRGETRESAGNDIILEGPAVRVLRDAIDAIQQRAGFFSTFTRTKLKREDRPAYPLYSLREGLVNAIVHRDYEKSGRGVSVELWPDRLVISNPGQLPDGWTDKDIVRRHESHPGNPDIARVFYLRGLMEQLGLGAQRVIDECVKLGAKRPSWKASQGAVTLTLYRAPEPVDAVDGLNSRQKKFMADLKPAMEFKAPDYAQAVDVSERQARRDLKEMEDVGLIVREGSGPATVYRLA